MRHKTHTEIRRASSTKWSTQIQQYAREIVIIEDDTPLPRRPPNAWQNKITIINDTENFPELPSRPRVNRNPTKEKAPQQAKESTSTQLVEEKLREMEEKMNKKMEEKIERLEKRCQDLEKSLEMTMKTIDRMVEAYERSEALNRELTQRSEEVAKKNAEAQIVASRAQFAEMASDLLSRMEDKTEWMETEMRESKKRTLDNTKQGLGKSQNTNQK